MLFLLACTRATLQVATYEDGVDTSAPLLSLTPPSDDIAATHVAAAPRTTVDAGIVPGCPTDAQGALSHCLWRRAVWAHHIWSSGLVNHLIVSGNAVYSPYTESGALKAALVTLGVPAERVIEEPQALHTDENIAYSLRIAQARGFDTLAIVSDSVQTMGTCDMVRHWSDGITCVPAPMDYGLVHARMGMGMPAVTLTPEADWVPLAERERRIAEQLGTPVRPNSWVIYIRGAILGAFGLSEPPPLLPP